MGVKGEVTFYEAVSSSVKGEYRVVEDLLSPNEPSLPCSCVEHNLEAAGAP